MINARALFERDILVGSTVLFVAAAGCSGPTPMPDAGSASGGFIEAAHLPWPAVPANAGVMLSHMTLVIVVAQDDPLHDTLETFASKALRGPWWQAVASAFGLSANSTAFVTGPPLVGAGAQTDAQVRAYVAAAIDGRSDPVGQTAYFVFLPDGVSLVDASGSVSTCVAYHGDWDNVGDAFGLDLRCTDSEAESQLQQATLAASHEIAEMATDPVLNEGYAMSLPSPAWTGSPLSQALGTEVADLCEHSAVTLDGFTYQRIWSNVAAAAGGDPCVPEIPAPYFNTSPDVTWYAMVGGSAVVRLMGWSTAPLNGGWFLQGKHKDSRPGVFQFNYSGPWMTVNGQSYQTIDNGQASTVTVTATGAQSGDYTILEERSTQSIPATSFGADLYHSSAVGVYVP